MKPSTFKAEIKEIKTVKSASLDMVHSIKLVTDNSDIVELSKLPSDIVVTVTIGIDK